MVPFRSWLSRVTGVAALVLAGASPFVPTVLAAENAASAER